MSYEYRYRCTTEGIDIFESRPIESPSPVSCINNPSHSIALDSVTIIDAQPDDVNKTIKYVESSNQGTQLLTGSAVWLSGLSFKVTPLTYTINGMLYTSNGGSITLDPADATFDRIDVIYVDSDGDINYVTGTPSAVPVVPEIPVDTLSITPITVEANSLTPEISFDLIYNEDTQEAGGEFDTSENTGGVRIDLNSTVDPLTGSVSIEGTSVADGDNITFTHSTEKNIQDVFEINIKPKSEWISTMRLRIALFNGNDRVSDWVDIKNTRFGLDTTVLSYQTLAIPSSVFNSTTLYNIIKINFVGTGSIGFFMDRIRFQGGIKGVSPVGEANLMENLGTGIGIFDSKVGVTLRVLSLASTGASTVVKQPDGTVVIGVNATLISHGDLSGLGDDDHLQYLPINGSRSMTGKINGAGDLGDLLVGDGTTMSPLGVGVDGYVLVSSGGSVEWTSAGAVGEVNTGANIGSGVGVFSDKSGIILNFRSIIDSSWVSVSTDGTEISLEVPSIDPTKTYVSVAGDTMTGNLVISSTTVSSGSGSGALTVAGGVGIGGNINGAGDLGDLLVGDGTTMTVLPIGTAGYILQSTNGTVMWVEPEISNVINAGSGVGVYATTTSSNIVMRTLVSDNSSVSIITDGSEISLEVLTNNLTFTNISVDNLTVTGSSSFVGPAAFTNLTASSATVTTINSTNLTALNASLTTVMGTNVIMTNASLASVYSTNANITNLTVGSLDVVNTLVVEGSSVFTGPVNLDSTLTAEDILINGVLDVVGTINDGGVVGDLLYGNGTTMVPLSLGNAGEVLTVNTGTTNPVIWNTRATTAGINIGSGVGVYDSLSGIDLKFRTFTSQATTISIVSNGTTINLDVNANNLQFSTISVDSLTVDNLLVNSSSVFSGEVDINSSLTTSSLTVDNELLVNGTSQFNGYILANSSITIVGSINGASDLGDLLVGDGTSMSVLPSGTDGYVLTSSGSSLQWLANSGEANTASNIGTGAGVFSNKSGVDMRFKSISAASSAVTIDDNGTTISLDISTADLQFTSISVDNLIVNGTSSFNNTVTINSTLISDSITVNDTLIVNGTSQLSNVEMDTLIVSGTSAFNDSVNVNSTLTTFSVSASSATFGDLTVDGTSVFNDIVNVNSTLIAFSVSASSATFGDLTVDGTSVFNDIVNVNSTLTAFSVSASSATFDNLTVSGTSAFNDSMTVNSSLTVSGLINGAGAKGDLLVGDGTTMTSQSIGTEGQVLTVFGSTATWQNADVSDMANIGGGVGVYSTTVGNEIRLKSLVSNSTSVSIISNGTTITLDVNATAISHDSLSDRDNSGAHPQYALKAGDTFSGDVIIESSTLSNSVTTGALVVSGGIGVQGKSYIEEIQVDFININGNTIKTTSGDLILISDTGDVVVNDIFIVGGNSSFNSTTESTSTTSGAVSVLGGVGIQKRLNVGGLVNGAGAKGDLLVGNGTTMTSQSIGTEGQVLTVVGSTTSWETPLDMTTIANIGGGVGIYSTTVGNEIRLQSLISDSTSVSVVSDGTSVSLDVNATAISHDSLSDRDNSGAHPQYALKAGDTFTGPVIITSTVNAVDTVSGALQVRGGVGIVKDVYVGGDTYLSGKLTVNGVFTTIESTTITIADNTFVVNAGPGLSRDGGYFVQRYQTPNDAGLGDVVDGTMVVASGAATSGSVDCIKFINDPPFNTAPNGAYNDWWIRITSGAGAGQVRRIKEYSNEPSATIYSTGDGLPDGMNLTSTLNSTSLFTLNPGVYAGVYFDEGENKMEFVAMATEVSDSLNHELYLDVVAKNLELKGTDQSLNTTTGALIVPGGIGVSKFINGAGALGDLLVGNGTTITNRSIGSTGQVLTVNTGTSQPLIWTTMTGEANTASNIGTGFGVFSNKNGVDLRFKSIDSYASTVSISSDGSTISLEVDTNNLTFTSITLDSLIVNGTSSFTGLAQFNNVNINSSLTSGSLVVSSNASVGGSLNVSSSLTSASLTVSSNVTVGGLFNGAGALGDVIIGNGTTMTVSSIGTTGQYLTVNTGTSQPLIWTTSTAEANTASNIGTGVGVFSNKNGVDLRFKSIDSYASTVSVSNNGTTISLDVLTNNLTFTSITVDSLIVNGTSQFNNMVTINSTLTTHNLVVASNVTIGGDLVINGTTSFNGDIEITNANIDTLIVNGTSLFNDSVNINSSLTIAGSINGAGDLGDLLVGDGTTMSIASVGSTGQVLTVNTGTSQPLVWTTLTGEANTASNIGTGVGVFSNKNGVDLRFKSIDSFASTVSVSNNGTTISLEVNTNNLTFTSITLDSLIVNGTSSFTGLSQFNNVNINSSLTSGSLVVSSNASVGGSLSVSSSLTSASLTVSSNVTVGGLFNGAGALGDVLVGNGTTMTIASIGTTGQYLTVNTGTSQPLVWTTSTAEANTASNIGTGTGLFSNKSGVDLRFRSIRSASSSVSISNDGSSVSLDVSTSNLTFTSISTSALTVTGTSSFTGTASFSSLNASSITVGGLNVTGSSVTAGPATFNSTINGAGLRGDSLWGNGTTLSVVSLGTDGYALLANSSVSNGVNWAPVDDKIRGITIDNTTPASGSILKYSTSTSTWTMTTNIYEGVNKRQINTIRPDNFDITTNTYVIVGAILWDDSEYNQLSDPRALLQVKTTSRSLDIRVYDSTNLVVLSSVVTSNLNTTETIELLWTKPSSDAVVELQAKKTSGGGPKATVNLAQLDFSM